VSQNASLLEYARVLHVTASADAQYLERLYHGGSSVLMRVPCRNRFRSTLILTGRQDSVCGYGGAWELLEHFARATFAVLDGAGHMMWESSRCLFGPRFRMAGPCRARLSAPSDFSTARRVPRGPRAVRQLLPRPVVPCAVTASGPATTSSRRTSLWP